MSRKTSIVALIALTIALILIPGVQAETPIPVVIVEDLPDTMVAGSSYDMVLAFNLEEKAFSFRAEIMVTCEDSPLGLGEVTVGPVVDLNGQSLTCTENMDVPGLFEIAKTSLIFESKALLITIPISTRINLMPEEYSFDVKLWADAYVEPEPTPSPPGRANTKPIADAGPDQTVYVDETVNFDGSGSHDPDGSIMSWSWRFGDGETDSGETVSHAYSEPGVYTVTLTVRDNRNAKVSDTCIVTVTEETEPTPPLKPAKFEVSNLNIEPKEVELGEEVTITFTATNVGEETGTCIVTLSVGDEPITMEVTLEGGESEEMEFELSPETEGIYKVIVDGLIGSFTVKAPIVIVPPKPAAFEVSDLAVSAGEVAEGEQVTVTVTVTNTGEEEGSHTVNLKIDGLVAELAEVTLEGGASTTITFTLTEAAGEHSLEIENLKGGFTVTAIEEGVTLIKFLSPGYVAGVLILIIIAGTTTYTLYRRGRFSTPKSPPGSENLGD